MPSNVDVSFENKVLKYFTAAEFVEYLGIPIEELLDRFDDYIEEYREDILNEIG